MRNAIVVLSSKDKRRLTLHHHCFLFYLTFVHFRIVLLVSFFSAYFFHLATLKKDNLWENVDDVILRVSTDLLEKASHFIVIIVQ